MRLCHLSIIEFQKNYWTDFSENVKQRRIHGRNAFLLRFPLLSSFKDGGGRLYDVISDFEHYFPLKGTAQVLLSPNQDIMRGSHEYWEVLKFWWFNFLRSLILQSIVEQIVVILIQII